MTHYTTLEQHKDGAWWYHPGWTSEKWLGAASRAGRFSRRHEGRPTAVIEHTGDFPEDQSCCTRELVTGPVTFGFAGEPLAEVRITHITRFRYDPNFHNL